MSKHISNTCRGAETRDRSELYVGGHLPGLRGTVSRARKERERERGPEGQKARV